VRRVPSTRPAALAPVSSGWCLDSSAVTAPQQPFERNVQSQPSSTPQPSPPRLQGNAFDVGLMPEPPAVVEADLM
jgi:hypothetical protein